MVVLHKYAMLRKMPLEQLRERKVKKSVSQSKISELKNEVEMNDGPTDKQDEVMSMEVPTRQNQTGSEGHQHTNSGPIDSFDNTGASAPVFKSSYSSPFSRIQTILTENNHKIRHGHSSSE